MTNKQTYKYLAQKYKQGSSSIELLSFCATADDIKRWGGVPAKTTAFHGGFQRALSDRHSKIKKFFDDSQVSPTSVVVAFREGSIRIQDLVYPNSAWADSSSLSFKPQFVTVEIDVEQPTEEENELEFYRTRVVEMLAKRLEKSKTETQDEPGDESDDNAISDESEQPDEDATQSSSDDSEELDVGRSKLQQFYEFISSESKVDTWLTEEHAKRASLSNKEKLSKSELEQKTYEPEERLTSLLKSLLRPAMIVDGQHRVEGANTADAAPIVFSICGVKDADWVEQVFQFVILNRLAKPISPSFLTSILNTSLTNQEVAAIQKRFDKIGIANLDRIIMRYLNHDARSPFFGMISEPGEVAGINNADKLSDKGMIKIAKRWMQISKNKRENMSFQSCINAKNASDLRDKWKFEVWMPYFYAFWDVIKQTYSKDQIWEKGEKIHLLYIVTMLVLQDMFIDTKAKANVRFSSIEDFRTQVKVFFEDVPAILFTNWAATGLQSGDGPAQIRNAIERAQSGDSLKSIRADHPLFKVMKS